MAIERYHGKYVSANTARQYIDIDSIQQGCRMMDLSSEKLKDISRKIELLKEICSKDALAFEGKGIEDKIENYRAKISDFSQYIDNLSRNISSSSLRVYNRRQVILNEESKRLDEKVAILKDVAKKSDENMQVLQEENASEE